MVEHNILPGADLPLALERKKKKRKKSFMLNKRRRKEHHMEIRLSEWTLIFVCRC